MAPRFDWVLAVLVSVTLTKHGAVAGPCDIYASAGTPCAAAHSVVRALFSGYTGRLYQLKRFNDNATLDVKAAGPRGLADSAAHDSFCADAHNDDNVDVRSVGDYPKRAACVVWQIYDQTVNGNHL